jgi:hypothetical protein
MSQVEVHLSEQDILTACRMYVVDKVLCNGHSARPFIHTDENGTVKVRVIVEITPIEVER